MNNKVQNILLGVLAVGLIGITVAYATLSQQLKINGTAKVASAKWDVHFANMSTGAKTGYAEIATTGKLTASGTTVSGSFGTLKAPGDSITYTFDVTNAGSINAKITGINPTTPGKTCAPATTGGSSSAATTVCNGITYTIQYTVGGKNLAVGDTLTACETKQITMKVAKTDNTLASEDVTVTATPMTITYSQY